MEEQIALQPENIRDLESSPEYFGSYMNMARLNIFNISNHVAQIVNLNKLPEEGAIRNSFLCDKNLKKVNWSHAFAKTVRFMPIIKVFDFETLPKSEREQIGEENNYGKDFDAMSDALKSLFTDLQEFRNDYTHYFNPAKDGQRKITISEQTERFLDENLKRALSYTKERFEGVLSNEDFDLINRIKIVDEDKKITPEGLVFFVSIFLEREYAFQFISKIKGLKGTQYKSFIATREVIMAFCLNLPQEKIISSDQAQAFSLDLINEMNRCPKTLYNVITDDEKKQFKPELEESKSRNIIENSLKNNVELTLEDFDLYIQDLTKRIRRENRFPYFALRYIDFKDVFRKFRFQLNLGKLKIGGYKKELTGELVDRTIVENVKIFGKLSDYTSESEAVNFIDKNNVLESFEQFAPCYNMSNNRIGISSQSPRTKALKAREDKIKTTINLIQQAPEAFLSLHELPKIILLEYLKPGMPEKIIEDFILVNDSKLLNMDFIEEVKAKLPKEWDAFNRKPDTRKLPAYTKVKLQYFRFRKEKVNEILREYGLHINQIPSRIIDYWLNIRNEDNSKSFAVKIKLMKRDCVDRLKDQKKGKGPKIGEMATFLAKDIVNMIIGEEKKKRITSFYYDKIQECIALFADSEKKQLLLNIIDELGLYENDGHPFLQNLNFRNLNYTREIYIAYLTEKGHRLVDPNRPQSKDLSWMATTFYAFDRNTQKTVVKMPENTNRIPYTLRQWADKNSSDLQQWLHNVTKGKNSGDGKMPLNLPTNLFDEELVNQLREQLELKVIEYGKKTKYNELFKLWWQSREDDVQSFYKAEREYNVYGEYVVRFIPDSKPKYAHYYQEVLDQAFEERNEDRPKRNKIERKEIERSFKRAIGNTEKEIRVLQEEDRIVLLMIEKLLDTDFARDIKLKNAASLLKEDYHLKQMVTGKLHFDSDGKEIKGKTNPTITRYITATRKRKAYGGLRKFIHDRRLPELFEFFDTEEIPLETLKIELDAYNKARQIVMSTVFALEKELIEKTKEEILLLNTGSEGKPLTDHIRHSAYIDWLLEKQLIKDDEYKFMNMVRNCFSHNQFPQKETMELIIEQWQPDNLAMQIAEVYKQKTETIINDIVKIQPV
jgi:hypothetical protein